MKTRVSFPRLIVYALLGAAVGVFLVPLIWLLLSSLKPIDQATAMPPTLFPRDDFAVIDGERVDVMRDYTIGQSGVVGELPNETGGFRRVFLTETQAIARRSELRQIGRAHV